MRSRRPGFPPRFAVNRPACWFEVIAVASLTFSLASPSARAAIDAQLNTSNFVSGQASELSIDGAITSGGPSTSITGATLSITFDPADVSLSAFRAGTGWTLLNTNTDSLSQGWVKAVLTNTSSDGAGQTTTGPILYFTVTPANSQVDPDDCDTLRFAGAYSDLSDQAYVTVYPSDPCAGQMAPGGPKMPDSGDYNQRQAAGPMEPLLSQPTECQLASARQALRIASGTVTADLDDVRYLDYDADGRITLLDATRALRSPCGVPCDVVAAATGADDLGNPKIVVYWTPVVGATSYQVFRRDEGQSTSQRIATVAQSDTNRSYPGSGYLLYRDVDASKTDGTEYSYTIRAANDGALGPISQEATALADVNEVPWDTVPFDGSDQSSAIWLVLYRFVTGVPALDGVYSLPNPIIVTGPDGLNYDLDYDDTTGLWEYTVFGPQGSYDAATNTYTRDNGETFQPPDDGSMAQMQGPQPDRVPAEIVAPEAKGPFRRVRSTDTGSPVGVATVVHLPMASPANTTWVRAEPATSSTPHIYLGHTGYVNGQPFEECDAGLMFNTGQHNWSLFAKGDKPSNIDSRLSGWSEYSKPGHRIDTSTEFKYVSLYWATGGSRLGGLLSALIFHSDMSFERPDAVGRYIPYRTRITTRKMKRMVSMAQLVAGVKNPLGDFLLISDVGMSGNFLYWANGSSGYWTSSYVSEDGAHTVSTEPPGTATVTVEGTLVNEYPIRIYVPAG